MVSSDELAKLIKDTTREVMIRNQFYDSDQILDSTIELSAQISAAVTIRVLEKLGVIDLKIK